VAEWATFCFFEDAVLTLGEPPLEGSSFQSKEGTWKDSDKTSCDE